MNAQTEGRPPVRRRIREMVLSTEFATARTQLVAAALHMAGCDWTTEESSAAARAASETALEFMMAEAEENSAAARAAFEEALTFMMAEAAPQVIVQPYGTGPRPLDRAYRQIERQALYLAATEFDNGRETTDASAALDYADDRLDDALDDYITAALGAASL